MGSINMNNLVYKINPLRVFDNFSQMEADLENYFMFGGLARVGLDIGNYAIKAALLRPRQEARALIAYGVKTIERPPSAPATEIDEVAIIQALRELLEEHKIRAKRVNLSISDASLYSRQLRIPKVKDDQLNRVIRQAAEKYIPFSIDEAIVDYQPIEIFSKDAQEMEIFIVAAKKSMVQKYLSILKEVQLAANVMDVSIFPTTKLLAGLYVKGPEAILPIIDIGHQSTTVVILQGKTLRFVRNFDLAGHHFTTAIANGLKVPEPEAAKIKKEGALYPDKGDMKSSKYDINVYVEPVLEEFMEQIQRCFAYCARDLIVDKIERAVICGGGSLLSGLERYLSENLGIQVERADPLQGLTLPPTKGEGDELQRVKPLLCAALGLAMGNVIKGN